MCRRLMCPDLSNCLMCHGPRVFLAIGLHEFSITICMVFHSRGAAPSHYERDDALLSAAQRAEALHFLAGVPRPAWMPQPPLAAMLPDAPRRSQPRATLASAAITQEGNRWASFVPEYATRLKQLDRSARAAGFEETLLIDRREAILDDPLFQRFGGTALAQRLKRGRPFCDAFKPVALWRALMQSREGDYVMCRRLAPATPRTTACYHSLPLHRTGGPTLHAT